MNPARLEAFSDGVFAIAITLLVLDLRVPPPEQLGGGHLLAALGHQWPSYAAYLISFLVIGIIWVNHHAMLGLVRHLDRRVLFANLALLLTVSVIPFPTRLFADYLTAPAGAHAAAVVYSATMLAMSAAFTLLWLALTRDARHLHEHIDPVTARAALRRFGIGGVVYAGTIALALISAPATLAAHAAIALYYCFDQLPVNARPEP